MSAVYRTYPVRLFIALAVLAATGCGRDSQPLTGPETPSAAASTAAASGALVFRSLGGGDEFTCGVTADQRAFCWGGNFFGQLGNGISGQSDANAGRLRPVEVVGGLRWRNVSVGQSHACGVTTDDIAYCWGYGGFGQLGTGDYVFSVSHPVAVAGGLRFTRVRAGKYHTCGITTAEDAYCWGYNDGGQLGDFSHVSRLAPKLVGKRLHWRWIEPGGAHTCGVTTDNRAWCFGHNDQGQLGDGASGTNRSSPVAVAGGHQFKAITTSDWFTTCAIDTDGLGWCWGDNNWNQFGDGTSQSRNTPIAIAGRRRWTSLDLGSFSTCGVTGAGRAFCWGSNVQGNLGDGTTFGSHSIPNPVGGNGTYTGITAANTHTCAVAADGSGWCWGGNRLGQLGDGTTTNHPLPVPIGPPL